MENDIQETHHENENDQGAYMVMMGIDNGNRLFSETRAISPFARAPSGIQILVQREGQNRPDKVTKRDPLNTLDLSAERIGNNKRSVLVELPQPGRGRVYRQADANGSCRCVRVEKTGKLKWIGR